MYRKLIFTLLFLLSTISVKVFGQNKFQNGEGRTINGEKEGKWEYFYDSGNLSAVGNYKKGKRIGKWKLFNENDIMTVEANFADGVFHGLVTYFYEDGTLMSEEVYEKGFLNGEKKTYVPFNNKVNLSKIEVYENGIFKRRYNYDWIIGELLEYAEGAFQDRIESGVWRYYYPNGKLKRIGNYVNGEEDGEWKWYYESGQLWRIASYVNGVEEGEEKWYYENGNIAEIGKYVNGVEEGEWKYYNESGKLEETEIYKNGELIETKE